MEIPCLIFITGASGAGKTTLLKTIEQILPSSMVSMNYFDSIGVPSGEEMIRMHGSRERWQEASTHLWIDRLLKITDKKLIFLEGQYNPEFVFFHLQKLGVDNYLIFCLYAEKIIREKRLIEFRNQPELVNFDMENWSNVLKQKTQDVGGVMVDTSMSDVETIGKHIIEILFNKLSLSL